MDTNGILDFLHSALRSVGAEVTSPWFYLQLGLILAGAGIAFAASALFDQVVYALEQLRAEVIRLCLRMRRRVIIEVASDYHAALINRQ